MNMLSKYIVMTLIVFVGNVTSASAALLSFDFTGAIVSSPTGLVSLGSSFYGQFSFDDSVIGGSSAGSTIYSPVDFSLNISGEDISFAGIMSVRNNSTTDFIGYDIIQVGRYGLNETINSTVITNIEVDLLDSSGTALTDESLPMGFNVNEWSSIGLAIRDHGYNLTYGAIDSITPSAVPVPAAVWLFGSSFLGFIGVARRKRASV